VGCLSSFSPFWVLFRSVFLAKKIGDKKSTVISLLFWIVCNTGLCFSRNYLEFFVVGLFTGVALGGSQALSRGIFAKMVPSGYESQMFSIYQISQRGTSWMGPLIYGAITTAYLNDPKPGLLFMNMFILIGIVLVCFVDVEKGSFQAKQYDKKIKDVECEVTQTMVGLH